MSLQQIGAWQGGIWALGVWAPGVWAELVGGDDAPRKSPHKGWDKEEWRRRVKEPDAALENTLREAYAELTGEMAPVAVLAQVDEIVRPVAKQAKRDIPLVIDWKAMARQYERTNALIRLWQEEQELRAIEEDDEDVLLMVMQ